MTEDPLVQASTDDLSWMTLGGEQIPSWAYNRDSARIAERHWPIPEDPDRELKLLKYQGDVVLVALCANFVQVLTFGLPFVLSDKAVCANTGLATISLSYDLCFLPFIGVSIGLELVALRRVLPSVRRITEPKLPVLDIAVRTKFYLPFMIIASIVIHGDVITNGIFIALLLKTADCDKDKYGHVRHLAEVLWAAMILFQLLYGIFSVVPIPIIGSVVDESSRRRRPAAPSNPSSDARATPPTDSDVISSNATATPPTDFNVVSSNSGQPVRYFPGFDFRRLGGEEGVVQNAVVQNVVYRTLFEKTQTHQGSIFTLADGARWFSIQYLESYYLHTFHSSRSVGSTALKALKKTVLGCYFFLFLESTLFLLTQCYVQSLTQGPVMTVSIVMSLLGGMITLKLALSTVEVYSNDVADGHSKYRAAVDDRSRESNAAEDRVPYRYRKWQNAFKFVCVVILVSYSWVLLKILADAGRRYG